MYCPDANGLLVVVFFVILVVVIVGNIAVFAGFPVLVIFFVFVHVAVFGNDVQVYGMGLRNLQLGFAFRATQDLALFHFVFVDVDFGRTLGAADHGSILRRK